MPSTPNNHVFHLCICADHRSSTKETPHNLDYCDIMVLGEELRTGLESLELHHSALLGKHLEYANSSTGMSIYGMIKNLIYFWLYSNFPNTYSSALSSSTSVLGVDSISHYTEVIRQVRYQSRHAVDSVRTFRLTCSELNGRYTSDQYTLQVRKQMKRLLLYSH